MRVLPYALPDRHAQRLHPWLLDLDTKVVRAEACFDAAVSCVIGAFPPMSSSPIPAGANRCSCAMSGPAARIGLYYELYHRADDGHLDFDPEFARGTGAKDRLRIRLKNLNNHLHLPVGDAGISPTAFPGRYLSARVPRPYQRHP